MFKHPAEHGMTYLQHFGRSMGFAFWSGVMVVTATVHAFLPCFFVTTTTDRIKRLAEQCQLK